MKSKTLETHNIEKIKRNKTADFLGLYKSAAETISILSEKRKLHEAKNADNDLAKTDRVPLRHDPSPSKKRVNKADLSKSSRKSRDVINNNADSPQVKSIMKNSSFNSDDAMDESSSDVSSNRRKKRNKSVSFMLDDNEIAMKKTKSNESLQTNMSKVAAASLNASNSKIYKTKNFYKKKNHAEKENNLTKQDLAPQIEKKESSDKIKIEKPSNTKYAPTSQHNEKKNKSKNRKGKRIEETSEAMENESTNNEDHTTEIKEKKHKKKKRKAKPVSNSESVDTEGEPQNKFRKKDVKPDVIAEDLENLSIGDNAHTLTNLLDEMTVADRNKHKKNKNRGKKEKRQIVASTSSSETADLEKIEEGKEKVIWKKRKWNKDKKGDVDEDGLTTSVIIENLPLKIMVDYKKLLSDYFSKFGLIRKIGVAEVYPSEEPKPVFTTTIHFSNEDAATQALQENGTLFGGSRIRLKRPLPPTQTTLVVRSYADISEQSLSSLFVNAGRIRSIKQLVKGKKSMATVFIEFDGPDTLNQAIKMAEDARIGGKRIHISRFELRTRKDKPLVKKGKPRSKPESDNEGDSEDSND